MLPVLKTPPGDDASSTLASAFLHASATTVAVQPADAARFGTPGPSAPIRFRMVRQSQQSGGFWSIADPTAAATFTATGRTGSTLTGVAFESGTNQDFAAGDLVAVVVTAADFADIHARLNAGPINVLQFGTVVGDGVTDDRPAIQAILDAHPGEFIYFPRTVTPAQYAASGGYRASYYLGDTLTMPPGSGIIGLSGFSAPFMFRFAARKSGIVMSGGCTVANVNLLGSEPYGSLHYWEGVIPAGRFPGVTEAAGASAADGIRVAGASCRVSNVICSGFGRDGINCSAEELGLPSGYGCEDSVFESVYCDGNRGNGVTVAGGDSNCSQWNAPSVNSNQFWGMDFDPFLSGTVISPQANNNGFDASENLITSDNATTAVASLVRAGNTVTLTWATPQVFHPGDGVRIMSCTNASFLGRWRVLTVAGDNSSLTYTQIAADATVTGGTTARANALPPDFTIQTASRTANVVTLTATAPIVIPDSEAGYGVAGNGFQVGQGITLLNCPNATFNGTFVVLSVSQDKRTITYAQTGQADATINGGTVRMAMLYDTWQCQAVKGPSGLVPERIMGGSYRSIGATNATVWVQPYAEGGQRCVMGSGALVLNPTWSNDPEDNNAAGTGHALVIRSAGSGTGAPTTNKPWGLSVPYDGDVVANEIVGLTTGGNAITRVLDVGATSGTTVPIAWQDKRGPAGFGILQGDPNTSVPLLRFGVDANRSQLNSAGPYPVWINAGGGGTGGLVVGNGTGGNPLTTVNGGQVTMFPIADSAAAVGAIFIGSDHGGKLCRKDSSGVVHVLSETP